MFNALEAFFFNKTHVLIYVSIFLGVVRKIKRNDMFYKHQENM